MAVGSHLTTPRWYSSSEAETQLLRSILLRARNSSQARAVRAIVDGDSQETFSGGQGESWGMTVNYELWKRYGNSPESQASVISVTGGAPAAYWGCRVHYGSSGIAGLATVDRYPYNMNPSVNNRYNNIDAGALLTLQADMAQINAALTHIPRDREYISRTGLKLRVLLPNLLGNQHSQMHYRCVYAATPSANYYGTTTGQADVAVPASASAFNNGFTEMAINYDFGGTPPTPANLFTMYPQVVLNSQAATRIEVGSMWFSSGNTAGITLSSMSAGGKTTSAHFFDRPNLMEWMVPFAPDIIFLATEANDEAGVHITASQHASDLADKILSYKNEFPDSVVIVLNDPDRSAAFSQSEWDSYPEAAVAAVDIAATGMCINRRRIMQELCDWRYGSSTFTQYVSDGVHYTVLGGKLLAEQDVSALFNLAGLGGMPCGAPSRPAMQQMIKRQNQQLRGHR